MSEAGKAVDTLHRSKEIARQKGVASDVYAVPGREKHVIDAALAAVAQRQRDVTVHLLGCRHRDTSRDHDVVQTRNQPGRASWP